MRNVANDSVMYDRPTRTYLSTCLADAFLAGEWDEIGLLSRADGALHRRPRRLRSLVRAVLTLYLHPPRDRPRELAALIELWLSGQPTDLLDEPVRVRRWPLAEPAMARRRWPVPEIASLGELAAFLEVQDTELAWFADVRGLERVAGDERLRHYRYTTLRRQGGPVRMIERPKRRLKDVQRRVLHELLDLIPAHDAAHGFVGGRSVRTHAALHTGRYAVLRIDLEDFFASVAAGRVYGTFRTAGYPESVAHSLTALCTNVVPGAVWRALPRPTDARLLAPHHRLGRRLATPHLPQGAPTSPALANLAAFGLDRRLAGLASSLELTYSRYADDLTFSGPVGLVRVASGLRRAVAEIAREEGFAVNERKSTLATRAGRQRVCGVVVNERLNVSRDEYDTLRAIVHNARRDGPASQTALSLPEFRAHLVGRIAWVASLNPGRGAKLGEQFSSIDWDG